MSSDYYYDDFPHDDAAEWLSDPGTRPIVEYTQIQRRDPLNPQTRYITDSLGRYRKVRSDNLSEKDLEHASSELVAQLAFVNQRKEALKKQREIYDSLRNIEAFANTMSLSVGVDDVAIFKVVKTFNDSNLQTPDDITPKKYTYVLSFIGNKWYLTGGSRRHNIFSDLHAALQVLADRAASIEVYGLKVDEQLL